MKAGSNYTSKILNLSLDYRENIQPLAHALSSELRLAIVAALSERGKNINELARELDIPVSTTALNVQVLEQAGILATETQPSRRGTMKICTRRLDEIHINLVSSPERQATVQQVELPIGGFSLVGDVRPTCGMASHKEPFGMDDNPLAFYHPRRFEAQILWMREGYLQYHFPRVGMDGVALDYLEFSFEACSEAPGHRNDWPSDIFVEINGRELGTWRCPGDFGGRRGLLNPRWWNDANTQYGHLKTWKVNALGSWLENDYIGPVTLGQLALDESDYIRLRIGVRADAECRGGLNLFGRHFGDFPQGIVMRFGFRT